ncbi:hypothetical protein BMS3Bbin01_00840 [bacterium BMS3Bbin01]|nr:hypothetical protein BMS3Bbin01_00840 [bacterium BMS3Bbin01]
MRATNNDAWLTLLGADPRPWLLQSDEPSARWVALTELDDRAVDDPDVVEARTKTVRDPGTIELIERLPDWETPQRLFGHNSPAFAPNLLHLLADMGLGGGDHPAIETLLDQMLRHQIDGRFATLAVSRVTPDGAWSTLLCDHHAITEVLIRYSRTGDPRVQAALALTRDDLSPTSQGMGWPCVPEPATGFRGPGRKSDVCPQVTLEALRAFSRLPADDRPARILAPARTILTVWEHRGDHRPYIFGHGTRFKTIKWPPFWYGSYWVLDTLSRYPELWSGPQAELDDRRLIAELAACLIAYNVGGGGTVTPRSCYRGFDSFSFGQKKEPSPFATARVAAILKRLNDLADQIASVDVLTLPGSKGGTGTPVPPPQT